MILFVPATAAIRVKSSAHQRIASWCLVSVYWSNLHGPTRRIVADLMCSFVVCPYFLLMGVPRLIDELVCLYDLRRLSVFNGIFSAI